MFNNNHNNYVMYVLNDLILKYIFWTNIQKCLIQFNSIQLLWLIKNNKFSRRRLLRGVFTTNRDTLCMS